MSDASHALKPDGADALLFDLGGVVVDIDFGRVTRHWAECAGCDPSALRKRFTPDAAYRRHEVGAISDEDYFASLRGSLGIDLTDAQFLEGWNTIFIGEVPGIADLLARAAPEIPLYAFSNTNRAHELYWSKQFAGVMGNFRKIFVSSTMKLRKPDAEAFQFVVKEIGAQASRIVFFDDSPVNVEGARLCGLQTVLVKSPADVAAALDALGL